MRLMNTIKMPSVAFFLLLLLKFASCEWDMAVLSSTSLHLLGKSMSPIHSTFLGKKVSSITYDPLLQYHYFATSGHPNASIFRIQVTLDGRMGPIEPLVKKQPDEIRRVAYDAESATLFWTTENYIISSELKYGLSDGSVLHNFTDISPYDIAVEPCTRYIYWSYSHSYIDRSLMDGTKRERIAEGLFMPVAITISQSERKIYWSDEGPGVSFRIGRALLDGSKKEIVYRGIYQQPSSIVVKPWPDGTTVIYWTNKMANELWSLKRNATKPELLTSFEEEVYALTTSDSFAQLDKHICPRLIMMRDQIPYTSLSPQINVCVNGSFSHKTNSCICTLGYFGSLCETSLCFNHCLYGTCNLVHGKPTCECPEGRSGVHCEEDFCKGFCYNGECHIEKNEPTCICTNGWYGSRCNVSEDFCSYLCDNEIEQSDCRCNKSSTMTYYRKVYRIGFFATIPICIMLFFFCIIFICAYYKLGKRPRVKKFYKVTPSKGGSASQPVRTSPDCEIAIENCCNMNICETPCYEPELRSPGGKSKKEEKRGLLKEMEVQPGTGKTF